MFASKRSNASRCGSLDVADDTMMFRDSPAGIQECEFAGRLQRRISSHTEGFAPPAPSGRHLADPAVSLGGMGTPGLPAYATRDWPAHDEALARRCALSIRCASGYRVAMSGRSVRSRGRAGTAAPSGLRGRQRACSDAAVRTCPAMKVPFGMAMRPDDRPCRKPAAAGRPDLAGAGPRHAVPPPRDAGREDPPPRLRGPAAPAGPLPGRAMGCPAGQWAAPGGAFGAGPTSTARQPIAGRSS